MFLLDLTDGHVAFNRDEEKSTLQVGANGGKCFVSSGCRV